MKNFTLVTVLSGILLLSFIIISCNKGETLTNKSLDTISRRWSVERIQMKIYYGGVFYKDTIVPRNPQGENFVKFDLASKVFQYRYNTTTTDVGSYITKGADSIISTTPSKTYRWKMLMLIDGLFTAMNTDNNNPAFPGATVETYYTFIYP